MYDNEWLYATFNYGYSVSPIIKDKKGNITSRDNYRPVAITCIASKIFELILLERYRDILYSSQNQFGFKPHLGTDMCIYMFKQVIEYYKAFSSPVYVVFMDASKAFDKINHYHLLAKLLDRGIPCIVVRLLMYWFQKQCFMVKWGHHISESFTVSNGVRQGGILSPIFFNVYMDELSGILNTKTGCCINACKLNHLFYADDSVLMAPSPRSLQNLINTCVSYARKYDLTFNEKKTKVMCFRPKGLVNISIPNFSLCGNSLEVVSNHPYLGIIIDANCRDNQDIQRQIKAIYSRGNAMIKRFKLCNNDVKVRLFKAYCSSFYCSQLWCNFDTVPYRKLQSSYNRIFRCLFKLPQDCSISQKCVEFNIDCFKVLIRKSAYNFRCRLFSSENGLIHSVTKSTFFYSCSLTKRWNTLFNRII